MAGTRKPRKQISSNKGATMTPKKVMTQASDAFRKNWSMGGGLEVLMTLSSSADVTPRANPSEISLAA